MGKSYFELYIHVIWTTKNRVPMLNETVEQKIFSIIQEKCREYKTHLIAAGNTEDHIHLLVGINPNVKIADLISDIKGATAFYINQKTNEILYWQNGYGVLTISKLGLDNVRRYVIKQKEHHRNNQINPMFEKEQNG